MDNDIAGQLNEQIARRELTGTLVLHPYNLCLYWSPYQWHSPKDAVLARPEWIFIGTHGWYADENGKQIFFALQDIIGRENLPDYPGEYIVLDGVIKDQEPDKETNRFTNLGFSPRKPRRFSGGG